MDKEPQLSVTRGKPTPEELAALVVALASLSTQRQQPRTRSTWATPPSARRGWKQSALPS